MKKILRIIALSSGIISTVSLVVLGYIYFEDFLVQINNVKDKIKEKNTIIEG